LDKESNKHRKLGSGLQNLGFRVQLSGFGQPLGSAHLTLGRAISVERHFLNRQVSNIKHQEILLKTAEVRAEARTETRGSDISRSPKANAWSLVSEAWLAS
jgi:hypothetical protein